jgi:hypothetical protein
MPAASPAQSPPGFRGIIRILPDFDDDLFLELFHKSAHAGWTSRDVNWTVPLQLSARQAEALAHLLTPVYLGEQTAMLGAGRVLTQLMEAGESSAQLYVAAFIMDEARHFEALTRLYQHLGHDPLSIRAMPEMLRFHHRLRRGDRIDWTWGILISDLFARLFYQSFARSQRQALFGQLATRILQDESRHQAFAARYLSRRVPALSPARRRALIETRDEILRMVPRGVDRIRSDCEVLNFDGDRFVLELCAELEHVSTRIGLCDSGPPEPPRAPTQPGHDSPAEENIQIDAEPVPSQATGLLPRCFGCLVASLCAPTSARYALAT